MEAACAPMTTVVGIWILAMAGRMGFLLQNGGVRRGENRQLDAVSGLSSCHDDILAREDKNWDAMVAAWRLLGVCLFV